MIIMIFALIGIIAVLFIYILFGNIKPKENETDDYDCNSELIRTVKIRKTLGIKSIKNNLITTKDDNLVCVLDVSTPEFSLMSISDQTLYENKLIELAFKINYNFKIITIVHNKDLKNIIEQLKNNQLSIENEKTKQYCTELINELMNEQKQYTVKKYYVIYDAENIRYDEKLKNLKKKVSSFVNCMSEAGCSTKILETNQLINFLSIMLKKYEKLDIQHLEETNIFDIVL